MRRELLAAMALTLTPACQGHTKAHAEDSSDTPFDQTGMGRHETSNSDTGLFGEAGGEWKPG